MVESSTRLSLAQGPPVEVMMCIMKDLSLSPCYSREAPQACALTCRAWYDAAHPYLYSTISIRSAERFARIGCLVEENKQVRPWIRKLCMSLLHHWYTPSLGNDLQMLAEKLLQVHALEFQLPGGHMAGDMITPFYAFTSILDLAFYGFTIADATLADLISHFPRLATLRLQNIRITKTVPHGATPPLPPGSGESCLQKLTLISMVILPGLGQERSNAFFP